MSTLKKGEDAGEQSSVPTWWAMKGFLANPCAALALVPPQEALAPSKGDRNSLET